MQPAPNGDPTLYIAAHSKAIVGWSQEDSDRLIKELMDWCTQPQYVFTMDWVNSGDMVWWDNRWVSGVIAAEKQGIDAPCKSVHCGYVCAGCEEGNGD